MQCYACAQWSVDGQQCEGTMPRVCSEQQLVLLLKELN